MHIRSGTSAVAVGPRYSAYSASSHSSVVCGTATEQQPGGRHAATIIAYPDQSKEPNRVCRTLSDNAYKVRQQQGPSTLERHVASWCHAESPCDKARRLGQLSREEHSSDSKQQASNGLFPSRMLTTCAEGRDSLVGRVLFSLCLGVGTECCHPQTGSRPHHRCPYLPMVPAHFIHALRPCSEIPPPWAPPSYASPVLEWEGTQYLHTSSAISSANGLFPPSSTPSPLASGTFSSFPPPGLAPFVCCKELLSLLG